MSAVNAMERSMSIDQLDDLVAERLDWVARISSGVAHELGNLVLVASIVEPDKGADSHGSAAGDKPANPIQLLRAVLEGLELWRRQNDDKVRPCTLKQWWARHGYMLRHLLAPPARLMVVNATESRMIDAATLCRSLAALIVAIDAQVRPLERVTLTIGERESDDFIRMTVETAPTQLTSDFVIPTAARHALTSDVDGDESIGLSDHQVEMTIRSLPTDAELKTVRAEAPPAATRSSRE